MNDAATPALGVPSYDNRATEADILACFRLLLGRNPNPEEWPGHSARAGEHLPDVVSSYLSSLEFTRRRLIEGSAGSGRTEIADLDGFRILASPDDLAVGRTVLAGAYEPEVAAVFRDVLRPGMTAIDIGANIGFFTMLAASLVGPAGSVLAFEPNSRNARMAEASRRLNRFEHVTIVQAAAGRGAGMLALNTSFSNGTTSEIEGEAVLSVDSVASVRVDDIALNGPPVALIKVDVEGAEYNALLGCLRTIRRDRPVLVLEFGPGQLPGISGVTGRELLQWLVDEHYEFEVIELGGTPTHAGRDCEAVMRSYLTRGHDHIDIIARPCKPAGPLSRFVGVVRSMVSGR